MSLHGLLSVTIGVPNVEETAAYYAEFGLTPAEDGWLATPRRREAAADPARADPAPAGAARRRRRPRRPGPRRGRPTRLGVPQQLRGTSLEATEPVTGVRVVLDVAPRIRQARVPATPYNGPGRLDRPGTRAPGLVRAGRVRPRKLGHAVLGSTDHRATMAFFTDGLGFKVSDRIKDVGAFLRCSTDHHNVLVLAAPVSFLHHTSWQVDDIDDVGRGACAMLEGRPERHVWGLGRHYAGSNFFWYLKDPAGNFSEYYSDMDCIIDDQLWTPEDLEGARGLFSWGPPPPPSFLHPEDLAAMMTGAHSAR